MSEGWLEGLGWVVEGVWFQISGFGFRVRGVGFREGAPHAVSLSHTLSLSLYHTHTHTLALPHRARKSLRVAGLHHHDTARGAQPLGLHAEWGEHRADVSDVRFMGQASQAF